MEGEDNQPLNPAQPEELDSPRKRPKRLQSIPSFMDIVQLIPTEERAIEFLSLNGVFPRPKDVVCTHCGYEGFRLKGKKTPKSIKCNRCSKGSSLMRGTFFDGTRAPLQQVLYMAVFWLSLSPASTAVAQLRCSSATVTEVSDKFRRLIGRYMKMQQRQAGATEPRHDEEDEDRLKPHIPKFARKDRWDEHVRAAAWREANVDNLWSAFLVAMRTVKDDIAGAEIGNAPWMDEASGKACCKYHLKEHARRRRE